MLPSILNEPLAESSVEGLVLRTRNQARFFDHVFVGAYRQIPHTKLVYTIFVLLKGCRTAAAMLRELPAIFSYRKKVTNRLMRAVYAIEFFIVLAGSFQLWSQAGGQYHLDLMPWWWKFGFPVALSFSVVRLSAAQTRKRTLLWLGAILLVALAAGLVTYYYHLNEPVDNGDDADPTLTATLTWRAPVESCSSIDPSSCSAPFPA